MSRQAAKRRNSALRVLSTTSGLVAVASMTATGAMAAVFAENAAPRQPAGPAGDATTGSAAVAGGAPAAPGQPSAPGPAGTASAASGVAATQQSTGSAPIPTTGTPAVGETPTPGGASPTAGGAPTSAGSTATGGLVTTPGSKGGATKPAAPTKGGTGGGGTTTHPPGKPTKPAPGHSTPGGGGTGSGGCRIRGGTTASRCDHDGRECRCTNNSGRPAAGAHHDGSAAGRAHHDTSAGPRAPDHQPRTGADHDHSGAQAHGHLVRFVMTIQRTGAAEGLLAATSWRALGTYVRLVVADSNALETAASLLRAEIEDVDRACSRFRDDSDLCLRQPPRGTSGPGRHLPHRGARRGAAGCRHDRWAGRSVGRPGRDRRRLRPRLRRRTRGWSCPRPVRPRPQEWRRIHIDRWLGTVRIPVGTQLDLGSSGKAHAAQRAAQTIARTTGAGVLVSLGGDIAVAGRPPDGGWTVRVAERPEEDGTGTVVVVRDGGVATSSALLRRWRRAGVDQHHIIDPRTGRPAAVHWRTATVCAGSCVDANAASTAAIIMGAGAADWLHGLRLPSRLVDRDGEVSTVGGWPDEPVVLP